MLSYLKYAQGRFESGVSNRKGEILCSALYIVPGLTKTMVALANAQTCFCLLSGHGQVATTAKPRLVRSWSALHKH